MEITFKKFYYHNLSFFNFNFDKQNAQNDFPEFPYELISFYSCKNYINSNIEYINKEKDVDKKINNCLVRAKTKNFEKSSHGGWRVATNAMKLRMQPIVAFVKKVGTNCKSDQNVE